MHINWKKTIIIALDLVLGTYLVFAFTRFNKPDETKLVCTKVNINIQDEMTNGFLNAKEIKKRLEARKLYPLGEPLKEVNARMIEETLKTSPFVKTAECSKTQDGLVDIYLTQRMPIVRIKTSATRTIILMTTIRSCPTRTIHATLSSQRATSTSGMLKIHLITKQSADDE